jgi:uncharacterized protein with HEPN domain
MKRDHIERSPKLYLTEIIESIEKIENYTKGLTRESFAKDPLRVDAVDANLRNIGEATRVLAKHATIKSQFYYYHIPYKILSEMRSELTHEYFGSDPNAMWNMAVNVLPTLKLQFRKIADEIGKKLKPS